MSKDASGPSGPEPSSPEPRFKSGKGLAIVTTLGGIWLLVIAAFTWGQPGRSAVPPYVAMTALGIVVLLVAGGMFWSDRRPD